jgi:hypothetical protein
MEQSANTPPEVATDEPASLCNAQPRFFAQESTALSPELIEAAAACALPVHPDHRARADAWSPDRIRTFITVLSDTGVVADAARAAGMTTQSAYRFRNSPKGRPFDLAWSAALVRARRRLADTVVSRAINGCVDIIVRDGKVWGERHRFDNRLTMSVLTRLDTLAKKKVEREEVAGALAHELDAFLDIVADSDAPDAAERAADFIRARCPSSYVLVNEADYLERVTHFARTGRDPLAEPYEEEEPGPDEWHA